jgi:FAD/FMN-containing dehydrogenase
MHGSVAEAPEILMTGGGLAAISTDELSAFDAALRGELLFPSDPPYEEARRVWNGMIDRHPGLIVRVGGAGDVVAAIDFVRSHDLSFSVRAGGHNVAGRAMSEGGLTIDLSRLRSVEVDLASLTVRVGAGATLGDIDHVTQAFGLAVPVGLVSETGVAGLTLHGGMGWQTRLRGLTLDNLVSVEIVTADGRLLTANEDEHSDLFWAVRGGGGNFGVVTSLVYRLYPVGPKVWVPLLVYPIEEASPVLAALRDAVASAPEELGVIAELWTGADGMPEMVRGRPTLVVGGVYLGNVAQGREQTRFLGELGPLIADLSGPQHFEDLQRMFDPENPDGRLYYWKSLYFDELTDEVIARTVAHALTRPSHLSVVDVWFLEGAATRVPVESTAFAQRLPYMVAIEADWDDSADTEANMAWARRAFADLEPLSTGGQYLNFPGMGEGGDPMVRAVYGPNYARLQRVKAAYDPRNLFRGNFNITPAS